MTHTKIESFSSEQLTLDNLSKYLNSYDISIPFEEEFINRLKEVGIIIALPILGHFGTLEFYGFMNGQVSSLVRLDRFGIFKRPSLEEFSTYLYSESENADLYDSAYAQYLTRKSKSVLIEAHLSLDGDEIDEEVFIEMKPPIDFKKFKITNHGSSIEYGFIFNINALPETEDIDLIEPLVEEDAHIDKLFNHFSSITGLNLDFGVE